MTDPESWSIKNFTLVIPPRGQARPRHARIKKKDGSEFDLTYKTKEQQMDEKKLEALLFEHRPEAPFKGPIMFGLRAYFAVPKSKPKKFQEAALAGELRPTSRPDLDNILKHIKDVATGIFWQDDDQVVGYIEATGKYYGEVPRYEIVVAYRKDLQ
jgi:Holliday junction resolvase RusA-like endonuclease